MQNVYLTFNSSCTIFPNCRTTGGPQVQARESPIFQSISTEVNKCAFHSCSRVLQFQETQQLVSQCSGFLCVPWKIQSSSPHFTACHGLLLVCLTSFAFLFACFCHSADSGFSPSPHSTSLLLGGHIHCLQLCLLRGTSQSFSIL